MHAVVVGAGPPVVLVHGFGVSGAYMLPLARALAGSFSGWVPDLPGQGRSERLRGRTSIAGLADALGDWISMTGLRRPIVDLVERREAVRTSATEWLLDRIHEL